MYAVKQDERVQALIKTKKIKEITKQKNNQISPMIVTWYDENIQFHESIPIVPI